VAGPPPDFLPTRGPESLTAIFELAADVEEERARAADGIADLRVVGTDRVVLLRQGGVRG
jgi:hypothetical protein